MLTKRKTCVVGFADITPPCMSHIAEIVEQLRGTMQCHWVALTLDLDRCDVLIASNDAQVEAEATCFVARLIEKDEPSDWPITLTMPVTSGSILDLLHRAEATIADFAIDEPSPLLVKPMASLEQRHANASLRSPVVKRPERLQSTRSEAPVNAGGSSETYSPLPAPVEQTAPAFGFVPRPDIVHASSAQRRPPVVPLTQLSEPVPLAQPVKANDNAGWTYVALTIYSIFQNSAPTIAQLHVDHFDPMKIDFRYRAFNWSMPFHELPEQPEKAELFAVPTEATAPPPFPLPGLPLDKLLWMIGIHAFEGKAAPWLHPEDRYRLQRWPNFTELNHSIDHMRMTAQIGNAYLSPAELADASGVTIEVAQRMLNAYSLMGLLQISTQAPARVFVRPPIETIAASTGLFGRLRQKLGW